MRHTIQYTPGVNPRMLCLQKIPYRAEVCQDMEEWEDRRNSDISAWITMEQRAIAQARRIIHREVRRRQETVLMIETREVPIPTETLPQAFLRTTVEWFHRRYFPRRAHILSEPEDTSLQMQTDVVQGNVPPPVAGQETRGNANHKARKWLGAFFWRQPYSR